MVYEVLETEPAVVIRPMTTYERMSEGLPKGCQGCQTPSFRPAVRAGNPMLDCSLPECAP